MARLATVKEAVNTASMEIGIMQTAVDNVMGSLDEDVRLMASLLAVVADELLLCQPYESLLADGMWLSNADGNVRFDAPKTDADVILIDRRLMIDGMKYRFLSGKGLEYGEVMQDFTIRLNRLAYRANNRVLDLDVDAGRVV